MIETTLFICLMKLGFTPIMRGYRVILRAVIIVVENPAFLKSITTKLYPMLATEFNVSTACIERRIRIATERAWLNANPDFIEEVFQYSFKSDKGKPTNSQLIATLAEHMRLEMIFNNQNQDE